jgi:hypothetical protein
MEIRPLRAGDTDALRALSLETTPQRKRLQSERFIIQLVRCQYYLDSEPDHCFVALEDGRPAGALLCAPGFVDYMRRFNERVYPRCKPYGYTAGALARQCMFLHKRFAGNYPAHCQCLWPDGRQDLAQPLFEALFAHLEAIECRGVCAFPGKKQYDLQDALEGLGFAYLGVSGNVQIMGKELF